MKTGSSGLPLPHSCWRVNCYRRAATGQHPDAGKGKRSMNSPSGVPDFGRRMCMRKLLLSGLNLTHFQVRVAEGSNQFSAWTRISPMRVDPKKANTAAVHTVCCVIFDHPDCRSRCPRCLRRGRDMTLLVFSWGVGDDMMRFPAPLRMALTRQSFSS